MKHKIGFPQWKRSRKNGIVYFYIGSTKAEKMKQKAKSAKEQFFTSVNDNLATSCIKAFEGLILIVLAVLALSALMTDQTFASIIALLRSYAPIILLASLLPIIGAFILGIAYRQKDNDPERNHEHLADRAIDDYISYEDIVYIQEQEQS